MIKHLISHLNFEVKSPGLSARKRIANQPPEGTPKVFLSTGSTRLNFAVSLIASKFPKP